MTFYSSVTAEYIVHVNIIALRWSKVLGTAKPGAQTFVPEGWKVNLNEYVASCFNENDEKDGCFRREEHESVSGTLW